MRILVCVKRVPITGGKMVLTADEQALETQHLGFTISPHEECGVEEAVRLVEADGGETVVLTLGPAEAEEQLRDCMAIGADRGILLKTDGEDWDAQSTAAAIVEAIRAEEPFDLILFGNESADTGNYQVGIRVAHALGLPVVTGLKKIELQDGSVRCERDAGGARDVYVVPLPAVLTVLEGLNLPRYPSVPGRLRAKSKPLAVEPSRARAAAREAAARRAARARASRRRSSARAPPRRRAVVELMQQLGCRMSVCLVEPAERDELSLQALDARARRPRLGATCRAVLQRSTSARSEAPAAWAAAIACVPAGRRGRGRRRRAPTAATSCSRTSRARSTSRSRRTAPRSTATS